ncbi:hypothetical protein [Streptomyces sp. NPDC050546]|uniref:hypothetical protein n=1 Tax=Streptomyces sp. NPDC050546 TaxID=3365628 RepID=UPI0037B776C9
MAGPFPSRDGKGPARSYGQDTTGDGMVDVGDAVWLMTHWCCSLRPSDMPPAASASSSGTAQAARAAGVTHTPEGPQVVGTL